MQDIMFSFCDIFDEHPPGFSLITKGASFQFSQDDIPRIRKEIASLIDNLSEMYLPIRKEQDEAEKKAKKAENKRAKRTKEPSNTVRGQKGQRTYCYINGCLRQTGGYLIRTPQANDVDNEHPLASLLLSPSHVQVHDKRLCEWSPINCC
jgi:hypothetical protein